MKKTRYSIAGTAPAWWKPLRKGECMGKTRYDFDVQIDELLDEALNVLSNREYEKLLDDISIMLAERDE